MREIEGSEMGERKRHWSEGEDVRDMRDWGGKREKRYEKERDERGHMRGIE